MKKEMACLFLMCPILLSGCSGPEQTRLYLQRELFEKAEPGAKYIMANVRERVKVNPAPSGRIEGAHAFSEGLAAVKTGGRWGYVDTAGKLSIPAVYDEAGDFVDGSAVVRHERLYGLIDGQGEYVLPTRFEAVTDFRGRVGFVRFESQYHLVDLESRQVVRLDLKLQAAREFSEGLAAVKSRNKWGFMDRRGREAIECRYEDVRSFSEGLCGAKWGGRWGYIDRSGKIAIEAGYTIVGDFRDGLAAAYLDSIRLMFSGIIINGFGNQVTEHRFYSSGAINSGIMPAGAATRGQENEIEVVWGYWKPRTDSFITGPDFSCAQPFSNGFAAVAREKKWGLIDTSGILKIGFEYDTITSFRDKRSLASRGGEWRMLVLLGDTIVVETIGQE